MSNPVIQEEQVRIAADYIRKAFNLHDEASVPQIAIVLGSGLGDFPRILTNKQAVSYGDIPHMPKVTVQGHDGQLIIGTIGGNNRIICFAGRVHSYEGIPWTQVCFQVQLMSFLGCKLFVLTNATGGLLDGMYEPCFMVIRDHIRALARIDPTSRILSLDTISSLDAARYEPQPPPEYWSESIGDLAMQIARDKGIELFEGSYAWTSGPSYETPAEVMFMKQLGGGAVGMSTVPEVIAALSTSSGDLQVFGLSMVTNLGAGISVKHLTHEEVEQNARKAMTNFQSLVEEVVMKSFGKLVSSERSTTRPAEEKEPTSSPSINTTGQADDDQPLKMAAISEATESVKCSIGLPTVKSAFIIPARRALEELIDPSSIKEVPLKNVGNFPAKSLAGNVSIMFTAALVDHPDQRILCIESLDVEGFGTKESAFLALLLHHMGIGSVLMTLHAESCTEDGKVIFGVVDDFINFSERTRALKYLLPMVDDVKMTNLFPDDVSDVLGKATAGQFASSLSRHCLMSFSGPMRPSRAERKMAHMLGADVVGTASLSLVYNLRFLNIKTAPMIMNSLSDIDKLKQVIKEVLSNVESNMVREQPKLVDTVSPLDTYVNLCNLTHKEATDVLDYVKSQFSKGADIELPKTDIAIMDMNLGLDLSRLFKNVLCSIPVKELPHFSNFFHGRKDLSQVVLELVNMGDDVTNAQHCWIVRGGFAEGNTEPAYACDVQLLVRLFQVMGITQLVFCQDVISLDESADAVGKCITVSDQVNFLGENPLIGHNDSHFGMRFPDMSECYNADLNAKLATFLRNEGLDTSAESCFFTNSLAERHMYAMKRSAELRVAARQVAKCGVASSFGAKEIITSRHMYADRRIRASMIALATDSLADSDPQKQTEAIGASKLKIVDALARFVKSTSSTPTDIEDSGIAPTD